MARPEHSDMNHDPRRKSAVRTALVLGTVAVVIYVWAIVSHL